MRNTWISRMWALIAFVVLVGLSGNVFVWGALSDSAGETPAVLDPSRESEEVVVGDVDNSRNYGSNSSNDALPLPQGSYDNPSPLDGTAPTSPTVQYASTVVTNDANVGTLLSVSGLGYVTEWGSSYPYRLKIYASGDVVEFNLWYYGYSDNDFIPNGNNDYVTFASEKTFILSIARPSAGKVGVLMCREVAYDLSCNTLQGGSSAYLNDNTQETLLQVSGLGGVRDTGVADSDTSDGYELNIYAESGKTVESTVWYYGYIDTAVTSSTSGVDVFIPHYRSFIVTIWRYDKMGHLFCRTNEKYIACSLIQGGISVDSDDNNVDKLNSAIPLADISDKGGGSAYQYYILMIADSEASQGFRFDRWQYNDLDRQTTTVFSDTTIYSTYLTFILTVNLNDNIEWLICRENTGILGCSSLTLATYDMNRNQEWKGIDSLGSGDRDSNFNTAALLHNSDYGRGSYSLQSYPTQYTLEVRAKALSGSSPSYIICQLDGSDAGSVITVTTEAWYWCGLQGPGSTVGFRVVENEWIGIWPSQTYYGNSDIWIGEEASEAMRLKVTGASQVASWSVSTMNWKGVDSKPLYRLATANHDWHVEISNHAVLEHAGDSSYSFILTMDTDYLQVQVYGERLLSGSQLRLYIDDSNKASLTLSSSWAWNAYPNVHTMSGSSNHEIRLENLSGDVAITQVRFIY